MFFGIFAANSSVLKGPTNATWFLAALFLTTICYFLLERILKYDFGKITVWSVILGICGFLISFTELRKVSLPWHINVIPVALFFFYLGVVFMRYLPDIMKIFERHRYVYACIFIFLGSAAGMMNGKVSMHGSKYNNGLLFILSSVLISFSLVLFLWKLPENRLISFIGKNTLVITAVHCPMLRFLEQYSKSTRHFVKTYPNLTGVILLAASMAAAWIIKRYFPFLTGEKRKIGNTHKSRGIKQKG